MTLQLRLTIVLVAVITSVVTVAGIFAVTSAERELYEDDGVKVEILPGMVASVDVLAGKRTVLDYIWNPMMKVKDKALTD